MSPAHQRLSVLAGGPDEAIDVAEAALLIAQEEYPRLDVAAYLARLDALAQGASAVMEDRMAPAEHVARLNRFLFADCGFSGNHDSYYDPRNSFLNEVIDRRMGIPITLSIVYCAVAQRLGLPVHGVAFPGHFLAKYVASPEILIDPFFGRTVTEAECVRRHRRIYGPRVRFDRSILQPARQRDIVIRVLRNLKQIYIEKEDLLRALVCVERILLFAPDTPHEIRDRGILYQRLECHAAALRDFERFLQLAPEDAAARPIRETLPELQRQAALLH